MLSEVEIDEIIRKIVACLQPQQVIIFGSYAKGKATIKSDLDICVIKETELPMSSRAHELGAILTSNLIRLDVHVYTPEEIEAYVRDPFSFVSSVLNTGRVMFRLSEVSRRSA
jgi:uncharacterized protein